MLKPYIYSTTPTTIKQLKQDDFDANTDISKIKQRMSQQNVFGKTADDADSHYKFATIKSPPYIMYHQGDYTLLNKPIIGIVGPRAMSDYAKKVLTRLFVFLAKYDIVTISGLADGVDSLCHELSIQHGIPTIAVLGGGLGHFIKSRKRTKLEHIVAHGGLILSEFKLKQEPTNYTFPQRNRIVAGLSTLLFVPEAGEKSGSLITITDAIKMNKPVYVSPNSIFAKNSEGILGLLSKQKVFCRDGSADFLQAHKLTLKNTTSSKENTHISLSLSTKQKVIVEVLVSNGSCTSTNLCELTKLSPADLMVELTMLEMDDIIYQERPGVYTTSG